MHSALLEQRSEAFFIPQQELLRRPAVYGYAIDPEGACEIDDAIYVEQCADQLYKVQIHIADTGLVQDSLLIANARELGWSKYFEDHFTVPMLPKSLSKDGLSLDVNHYGLGAPAVTVEFKFDPVLRRFSDVDIFKSRVFCKAVTYAEFSKRALNGEPHARRILYVGDLLNRDIDIQPRQPNEGRAKYAVGEFMVAGNRIIADEARKHSLPWVFRNHVAMPEQNLRDFDITAAQETMFSIINAMRMAHYSSSPMRHEGLSLMPYTHTTSPLRRFADFVNLQTLHALLSGHELPYTNEDLDVITHELTELTLREAGRLTLQLAKNF